MNKQFKVENSVASPPIGAVVFDRTVLAHHTMDDAGLAAEILTLFSDQLDRLEATDWASFDLPFEMHTLRGAAAAVGAMQLEALAGDWRRLGAGIEGAITTAISEFRKAAKA